MLTIKFGRIVQAGIVFVSLWATAGNAAAVPLTASVDDQRGVCPGFPLAAAARCRASLYFGERTGPGPN